MVVFAAGRRIYTNLKKAVQYMVSIHIPIILTVSLPLFFGWIYPDIYTSTCHFPQQIDYGPYVFNRMKMNLPRKTVCNKCLVN
jgi:hypothetical protein